MTRWASKHFDGVGTDRDWFRKNFIPAMREVNAFVEAMRTGGSDEGLSLPARMYLGWLPSSCKCQHTDLEVPLAAQDSGLGNDVTVACDAVHPCVAMNVCEEAAIPSECSRSTCTEGARCTYTEGSTTHLSLPAVTDHDDVPRTATPLKTICVCSVESKPLATSRPQRAKSRQPKQKNAATFPLRDKKTLFSNVCTLHSVRNKLAAFRAFIM